MKEKRRFTAIIAAMALAATMAIPSIMMTANAATANKVTITNEQGTGNEYTHKYTVYKIFDGTVTDGALEGITFAKSGGFSAFLTALKADSTIGGDFSSATNEAAVANILSGYAADSNKLKAFAAFVAANPSLVTTAASAAASPIDLATDGYYLIVENPPTGTPEDVGMTRYLLTQYDASAGVDIDAKSAIPSVEKKIKENASYTTDDGYGAGYNDTADYCIGDTVPFELIGSLPSNIGDYSTYKYIFHDTLGTQFTLNTDSIVVTVKNDSTTKTVKPTSYSTTTADGDTLTVTFNDLLSIVDTSGTAIAINSDSKIYVNYTAVLNDNAVIGRNGQTNEVYLEYSNNPDAGGSGTTSKTPVDKVVAFTYELDVNKIDGATELPLDGAQFVLYKTIDGVDYYANLSSSKIVDWVPGFYSGTTFTKSSDNTNLNGTAAAAPTLTSGSSFSFIGLDDGTYKLKEITAPDGYNKLTADIPVVIDADTSNGQSEDGDGTELVKLELTVDGESVQSFDASEADQVAGLTAGQLAFDVANTSGSTLPGTGGMGTKLFILGGGVTAAATGIYLISRKRAKKEEEE